MKRTIAFLRALGYIETMMTTTKTAATKTTKTRLNPVTTMTKLMARHDKWLAKHGGEWVARRYIRAGLKYDYLVRRVERALFKAENKICSNEEWHKEVGMLRNRLGDLLEVKLFYKCLPRTYAF